jgi:hypothetical protein
MHGRIFDRSFLRKNTAIAIGKSNYCNELSSGYVFLNPQKVRRRVLHGAPYST